MAAASLSRPSVLLLAPSVGFGGGIERVATAMGRCLGAEATRIDLFRREYTDRAEGSLGAKARFSLCAVRIGVSKRPRIVFALHVGILPVAVAVAAATRAQVGFLGIGHEVWGPLPRTTRAMIAHCDRLLAISSFTADVLARRSGVPRGRIHVVPLPVDEEILLRARDVPCQRPRGATLVTVSRMSSRHRYKGHFAIAACLPEVLRRRPDARWIVVGDGDDREVIRKRCFQLGVAHAAEFVGLVSDERLAGIYRHAAALVLPSVADIETNPPTGEGFGLVYAEAGAFGVPSIASSASGGAADFVVHDATGLTVPPDEPQALATAIVRLLGESSTRARLGAAARARTLSHHTPHRFCADLRTLLGVNA